MICSVGIYIYVFLVFIYNVGIYNLDIYLYTCTFIV